MRYVILFVLGALLSASTVHGSMITFTQTGLADGHFLDRQYQNRPYTFTAVGDLNTVHDAGWSGHESEGYQVDLFSASITIQGLGRISLPDGYYSFTVSPLSPEYLFLNVTGPDPWTEFFLKSPVFSGWDLTTSIEPTNLESRFGIHYSRVGNEYACDFGESALFSATVAPVPEPGTIVSLAAGLLGLLLFNRYGRRSKIG